VHGPKQCVGELKGNSSGARPDPPTIANNSLAWLMRVLQLEQSWETGWSAALNAADQPQLALCSPGQPAATIPIQLTCVPHSRLEVQEVRGTHRGVEGSHDLPSMAVEGVKEHGHSQPGPLLTIISVPRGKGGRANLAPQGSGSESKRAVGPGGPRRAAPGAPVHAEWLYSQQEWPRGHEPHEIRPPQLDSFPQILPAEQVVAGVQGGGAVVQVFWSAAVQQGTKGAHTGRQWKQ
jgi:hypothetical protein